MKINIILEFFLRFLWLNILYLSFFTGLHAFAIEETQDNSPIKIGMSVDLSSTSKPGGEAIKSGVQIYFDKINDNGGIGGRKLVLLVLDDGYKPLLSAKNVRQLIDQDQVLALIGNTGTPSAVTTMPILESKKVLLFAPRTGSSLLRDPSHRYVINLRASYEQEIDALIKALLKVGFKPSGFAFFIQNDTFGQVIYQASLKVLKEAGFENPEFLPYGRYPPHTLNVTDALANIVTSIKQSPQVFILAGVYKPNAEFIHKAKKIFPQAIFATVSNLILPEDIQKDEEGRVISMQVVPSVESDLPAVKEYREDLKRYGKGASASGISLEGYLAAKLFVLGLKEAQAQNKLNREGIIDIFESMHDVDIGIGVLINFDKTRRQVLNEVWPTIIKNGKFVPLLWSSLPVNE